VHARNGEIHVQLVSKTLMRAMSDRACLCIMFTEPA
jgi:hypothetical protein